MEDLHSTQDQLILRLKSVIAVAVRVLAVLMTLVILWGVIDVAWVLYQHLMEPPFMLLTIGDILDTFGAFMAVLIAIEIFTNITVYLQEDVIHVKIVMATALMAIARKVIILDYSKISADTIWATAGLVLAMSIGYWLVVDFAPGRKTAETPCLSTSDPSHNETSNAAAPTRSTPAEGTPSWEKP